MLIRILSAVFGIPLLIFIVYTGGMALTIAVTAVTIIAIKEFYDIFNKAGIFPFKLIGSITGAVIVFMTGMQGEKTVSIIPMLLITSTMVCFLVMVFKKSFRVVDLGITLLGIVYVSIFINVILMVYNLDKGPVFIWLVFIVAWFGDTAAYFSGLALGKHRLSPAISPKKSVEGAIGGLMGSITGSIIFGIIAQKWTGIDFNVLSYITIGLVGGFLSQLGDLTASIVKRFAGVKDFGNIIPGHGGIMDRFDSILFTTPVIYIYVKYFL